MVWHFWSSNKVVADYSLTNVKLFMRVNQKLHANEVDSTEYLQHMIEEERIYTKLTCVRSTGAICVHMVSVYPSGETFIANVTRATQPRLIADVVSVSVSNSVHTSVPMVNV
ncbi:hypothetical protein AHF37_11289 [Paragonimus kellicotti]|nr:hypothetical protein AHF37_11289 [Paragonimus kellicotti]